MVEFTGFGPILGVRVAHDLAPLPKPQVANVVPAAAAADRVGADLPNRAGTSDSGARGGTAQSHAGSHAGGGTAQSGTGGTAQAGQDGAAAKTPMPLAEDTLTGPPPTFDTTPLDLRTDLRLTLARMQANGYGHGAEALAPAAETGQAAAPARERETASQSREATETETGEGGDESAETGAARVAPKEAAPQDATPIPAPRRA